MCVFSVRVKSSYIYPGVMDISAEASRDLWARAGELLVCRMKRARQHTWTFTFGFVNTPLGWLDRNGFFVVGTAVPCSCGDQLRRLRRGASAVTAKNNATLVAYVQ